MSDSLLASVSLRRPRWRAVSGENSQGPVFVTDFSRRPARLAPPPFPPPQAVYRGPLPAERDRERLERPVGAIPDGVQMQVRLAGVTGVAHAGERLPFRDPLPA